MKHQDHNHQRSADAEESIWTVLPVALIVVLTVGIVTLGVLKSFNFGPMVGDVIVFQKAGNAVSADGMQRSDVTATLAAGGGPAGNATASCVLNPAVMAAEGGSLVVERSLSGGRPMYQVHWAGQRTSKGAGNCGSTADLLIASNDLLDLAGAAGGFGVNHKILVSASAAGAVPTMLD